MTCFSFPITWDYLANKCTTSSKKASTVYIIIVRLPTICGRRQIGPYFCLERYYEGEKGEICTRVKKADSLFDTLPSNCFDEYKEYFS